MNIISNDCTAGFIYKNINMQYMNPFIWTSIDINNFIKLIENYDSINFLNITNIQLINNNSKISIQNELCPTITIDNKINIYFFHHFQKENTHSELNTNKRYIYDENIIEYVKKIYYNRIQRMCEHPVFIWSDTDYKWYGENLEKLNNIKTNYKIIVYTNKSIDFKNENIIVKKKIYNQNLIEKNAIELSSLFKKTLIYTCCDEKYSHFIPLFCAALLYSNENIDIEIGVSISKLTNNEELAINYLRNKYKNSQILIRYNMFKVDYNKSKVKQAIYNDKEMMINSVRFVSEPLIKNTYTYISDIDIISFEKNFYNIHIKNMDKNNLVYDNIVRKNTNRLSGLHFVKTKYHYPINYKNLNTEINDEQLLFEISKNKYTINNNLIFRPVHGIHMSLNRNITTINNIPGWNADKWKNHWQNFTHTDIYNEIYKSFDKFIIELIEKLEEYYANI